MISDRLPAMSLQIKGLGFPNRDGSDRRFEVLLCQPGEAVELRLEPKNKHDPLAIGIFSIRGSQLGYVSAERCGRIGQLIRQGRDVQAIFQGQSDQGAWIRVAFDGEAPALPEERSEAPQRTAASLQSPAPDFYPDEEWPDA